jgi:hypothetical protein
MGASIQPCAGRIGLGLVGVSKGDRRSEGVALEGGVKLTGGAKTAVKGDFEDAGGCGYEKKLRIQKALRSQERDRALSNLAAKGGRGIGGVEICCTRDVSQGEPALA